MTWFTQYLLADLGSSISFQSLDGDRLCWLGELCCGDCCSCGMLCCGDNAAYAFAPGGLCAGCCCRCMSLAAPPIYVQALSVHTSPMSPPAAPRLVIRVVGVCQPTAVLDQHTVMKKRQGDGQDEGYQKRANLGAATRARGRGSKQSTTGQPAWSIL